MLAGGRYDGLIGSLGGNETPGVGWAAGVERLAMLIDEPAVEQLDVAIVAENDLAGPHVIAALHALRKAGFSCESITTGSPRKRYDKAVKTGCRELVQLTGKPGGGSEIHVRVMDGSPSRIESVLLSGDWTPNV